MERKKHLNTSLSSYLIFIPISFQERKAWAETTFRARGGVYKQMY